MTYGTLNISSSLALQNSTLTTGGTGVVFDSSVASQAFTFGGLSGSANIALQNNAATPVGISLSVGNNNSTSTFSGNVTGTTGSSFVKVGTGKETLTGVDSAANTTISAGTLGLGASNRLTATSNVTLAGGTLSIANASGSASYSQGTTSGSSPTGQAGVTASTFGAGQLSVTAGNGISYLDFGAGNTGGVFSFASYDFASLGDLYILNYNDGNFTGTYTPGTGGGPDQLFFGGNGQTAQQLQHVFFVDPIGAGGTTQTGLWQARLLSTGEVVAPEPSQWLALIIGALGIGALSLKARSKQAGRC